MVREEFVEAVGPSSSAVRLSIAGLAAFIGAVSAGAQAAPQTKSPASAASSGTVDQLIVDKLVWSTLIALDQGNRTGNYSVLRDIAAPTFQNNNSAATLAGIFEPFRRQRIDLSNTVIVTPVYERQPAVQAGALSAKGVFPLRAPIGFDLLFESVSGEWRLLAISVAPLVARGVTKH